MEEIPGNRQLQSPKSGILLKANMARIRRGDPPGKIPIVRRYSYGDDDSDLDDSSIEISSCSSDSDDDDVETFASDNGVDTDNVYNDFVDDDDSSDYDEFGGDSDDCAGVQPPSINEYKGGMEAMLVEADKIQGESKAETKENNNPAVVTKAYVGGMEVMLAAAVAKREARIKEKEKRTKGPRRKQENSIDSTSSNIPANSIRSTFSSSGDSGIIGMEAMLADAIAKRGKRKQHTATTTAEEEKSSASLAAQTPKPKVVEKSTGPVYMGSMADMLAAAVAKREERIAQYGALDDTLSILEDHNCNDYGQENDQELSMPEMVAKLAEKRHARVKAKLAREEFLRQDQDSDDGDELKDKHKEKHRKNFVSVAEEAATYGRLVRLTEEVVEAQGNKKKRHPLENDTWSGPKLRTDNGQSRAMRAIQEAAAVGRMKRVGGEQNIDAYHNDDSDSEDIDIDNQVDDRGRKVSRTGFLLDKHIKDTAHEKKDRVWSDSDAIGDRDHKTSQYKSFDDVCLPTDVLPTYARIIGYKAQSKRTFANGAELAMIAMRMAEKNDNKKNGENCRDEDGAPVMDVKRLRVLESISNAVAASAWEREYRLQKPKAELKVTRRCRCPYCKDPNPYQTHKYKRLMYPERFADDQQEYEAEGVAAATAAKLENKSNHGGKTKKKTIRIVRKRKKKSSSGLGASSHHTTRRVINETSLTPEELQLLKMHLEQQGTTDMTADELILFTQQLTGVTGHTNSETKAEEKKDGTNTIEDLLLAAEDLNIPSSTSKEEPTAEEQPKAFTDDCTSSPDQDEESSGGRAKESRSRSTQSRKETTKMNEKPSKRDRSRNPLRGFSSRAGRRENSVSDTEHGHESHRKGKDKSSRRGRLKNPLRGMAPRPRHRESASEHIPARKEPRRGIRNLQSKVVSKTRGAISISEHTKPWMSHAFSRSPNAKEGTKAARVPTKRDAISVSEHASPRKSSTKHAVSRTPNISDEKMEAPAQNKEEPPKRPPRTTRPRTTPSRTKSLPLKDRNVSTPQRDGGAPPSMQSRDIHESSSFRSLRAEKPPSRSKSLSIDKPRSLNSCSHETILNRYRDDQHQRILSTPYKKTKE